MHLIFKVLEFMPHNFFNTFATPKYHLASVPTYLKCYNAHTHRTSRDLNHLSHTDIPYIPERIPKKNNIMKRFHPVVSFRVT